LVIGLLLFMLLVSLLLNVGLLVATAPLFTGTARLQEKHFSHAPDASNKVMILSLDGVIYNEEDGFVKRQIDAVREDERVKAVVLRVNSPGGAVSDSDYLYHHLNKLRKERGIPVVVSMGGLAASGGYYVSMAVGEKPDTIFAEPGTWTGSIGVIIPHFNARKLLNQWGVREDSVTSHPLKNIGSFAKSMTDEERAILQTLVDDAFGQFKKVIRQGRPKYEKDPEALERLATGQVYSSKQALEHGLVDQIGFLEDAVDRAVELAGVAKDDVSVVRYVRAPTLVDVLLGAQAPSQPEVDLATLLDMATPRAYYLYTNFPPVVRSRE
jgi:protease-4